MDVDSLFKIYSIFYLQNNKKISSQEETLKSATQKNSLFEPDYLQIQTKILGQNTKMEANKYFSCNCRV